VTRRYVEAIAGTNAIIVDNPQDDAGPAPVEKYAVTVGGGRNHRLGLDDGVLIKDNHIALAGSPSEAVRRAREVVGHLHKIEVEVATLDRFAKRSKSKRISSCSITCRLRRCGRRSRIVREAEPNERRTLLEASGGITIDNVRAYAEAGVDLISIGALTHSAPSVDISFRSGRPEHCA
jgi:nicotinate-nucleotide pyrophosphorylase (carboxylating)